MMRIILLLVACLLPMAATPIAANATERGIVVSDAWARATPGASTMAAVYLTITNYATEADTLVSVTTPIAERAETHTELLDQGVTTMRALRDVVVKAGAHFAFAPDGAHIMLMNLKHRLAAGDRFPLTLVFAKSGAVTTTVAVRPLGATPPPAQAAPAMPGMNAAPDMRKM